MKKLLDIYEGIFNTNDENLDDTIISSYFNDEDGDFYKKIIRTRALEIYPNLKNKVNVKYEKHVLTMEDPQKRNSFSVFFHPNFGNIKDYIPDLECIKLPHGEIIIQDLYSNINEDSICRTFDAKSVKITAQKIENLIFSYTGHDQNVVRIDAPYVKNLTFTNYHCVYFKQNTNINNCIADGNLHSIVFYDPFLFDEPIDWLDDKIDWRSAEIYDLNKKEYIDSSKLTRKKVLACYNNDKRYRVEKTPNLLVGNLKEFFPSCTFPNIQLMSLRNNRVEIYLSQDSKNKPDIQIKKR